MPKSGRHTNVTLAMVYMFVLCVTCIDGSWDAHGTKKDLLATRAVCRRLRDVATPHAFQHITVLQDPEGYQRLRAISKSNLRTLVRSLTYNFEDFSSNMVSENEFDDYMTANYEDVPTKREGIYEDYCRGRMYQSHLHDFNWDVAHLTAAFTLLDNLRSIRISQIITARSGPWFDETLVQDMCTEFLELPTSCRVLDTIATSLSATTAKLKALTLRSSPHSDIGPLPLTGLIQELSLSKAPLYRTAFSHLKALSVHIPWYNLDNFKGLWDFIRCLSALAELTFTGQDYDDTQLVLPTLRLSSQLLCIDMSNVYFSSPAELTDFFCLHSESLQRIKLSNVGLRCGSWEAVFLRMRDTLNISSSEMFGDFYVGLSWARTAEIGSGLPFCHGKELLPHRFIEDYVERATDVGPFDMLRSIQSEYPEHTLREDCTQCFAGVCPYFYTPQEAEKKFMGKMKQEEEDGWVYALDANDFRILGVIICRQGRTELGSMIKRFGAMGNVQKGRSLPHRIHYTDGIEILLV